jgi:hypothetical protein
MKTARFGMQTGAEAWNRVTMVPRLAMRSMLGAPKCR